MAPHCPVEAAAEGEARGRRAGVCGRGLLSAGIMMRGMCLALLCTIATPSSCSSSQRTPFQLPSRQGSGLTSSSPPSPPQPTSIERKHSLDKLRGGKGRETSRDKGSGDRNSPWGLLNSSKDGNSRRQRVVVFLDLDNTAIWGNDGNDLGIAFQQSGKDTGTLTDLYQKLVNPQAKLLLENIRARGFDSDVVIYTRRSSLVTYMSPARQSPVDLEWDPDWVHAAEQFAIPGGVKNAEEVMGSCQTMLLPSEVRDLRLSFERLMAARDALTRVLGLKARPTVVVTSGAKKVRETAKRLGYKEDQKAYLWDDNDELRGKEQVVVVDKYVGMPREQRKKLMEFLERALPASRLSPEVARFMLSSGEEQALGIDIESGEWRYRISRCSKEEPGAFPCPADLIGGRC
mmetsp:Transcript_22369/g.53586  ORF Transcript_22369/g.53586 Transcript_22369/m.53586 type:complete len:402 (+) Transcript_22369:85-1290(+)